MTDKTTIVVLDGYTLNPGDLSWDALRELGEVTVYERTPPSQTVERAIGADVILTNKTALSASVLDQLPRLKYIGVLATGFDVVDREAAHARSIPVTNIPTYGTESVAQMVFAHVLNLTQHVAAHDQTVHEGKWSRQSDFCYWDYPMVELAGRTFGIVGYGRIGKAVGRLAAAFGMTVIAHDEYAKPDSGAELVTLDEVFERSDVVSLHCPLTPQTRNLVDARRLRLMKPQAYLINTSRGPLVNDQDLADALNEGVIAGAGLDVVSVEPIGSDNPLLRAQNCSITPHIAWATTAARSRLMDTAVSNLRGFLEGSPTNVVN